MAFKKKDEPKVQQKELPVKEKPPVTASVPLCDCGKPVAEGQTYVCKEHVRIS